MKRKFYVSWALCDRAYGGPEEGGWYYNFSYPVSDAPDVKSYHQKARRFTSEEQALRYASKLNKLYPNVNEGRAPIYSVLSDGIYKVLVYKGKPTYLPKKRPYYS